MWNHPEATKFQHKQRGLITFTRCVVSLSQLLQTTYIQRFAVKSLRLLCDFTLPSSPTWFHIRRHPSYTPLARQGSVYTPCCHWLTLKPKTKIQHFFRSNHDAAQDEGKLAPYILQQKQLSINTYCRRLYFSLNIRISAVFRRHFSIFMPKGTKKEITNPQSRTIISLFQLFCYFNYTEGKYLSSSSNFHIIQISS